MEDLFKPEDFKGMITASETNSIDNVVAKANQILKERGEVFYGFGIDSDFWQRNKDHRYLQYHKALVVCKTPIKED